MECGTQFMRLRYETVDPWDCVFMGLVFMGLLAVGFVGLLGSWDCVVIELHWFLEVAQ